YTREEKDEAVQLLLGGIYVSELANKNGIPDQCLQNWRSIAKMRADVGNSEGSVFNARRGPDPLPPKDAEDCIRDWIIARQRIGSPVKRQDIIRKGRVVSSFSELTMQISRSISKVLNMLIDADVRQLFRTLSNVIIEEKMDTSKIFNVDETAFDSSSKTTRVVILRGSKNVWHTDPNMNFYLSFVACGSVSGFVVPPLFILPGERVDNIATKECDIYGAAVTTANKASMTASLFAKWLVFFSNAAPALIKRPLLLLMDGCSSHLSTTIANVADRQQIRMSFKSKLKLFIDELIRENGETLIVKAKVLQIASLVWSSCNFNVNISTVFKSCGIYPLSMVMMSEKLHNFQRNETPVDAKQALWLRHRKSVQNDLLLLPTKSTLKARKKYCYRDRQNTHP
ncbi:DNA binding protein, partial [Phytophthora megakarya]